MDYRLEPPAEEQNPWGDLSPEEIEKMIISWAEDWLDAKGD
jgi:hypothetical protein